MTFANIEYLFLLILLIPYIIWYLMCHLKSTPALRVSSTEVYRFAPKTIRQYLLHTPFICRLVCLAAVIVALARPQTTNSWSNKSVEGIDIMLCMDVSTSMLAMDIEPDRVNAAREVAKDFVSSRPNDNIGLTLFAGQAYTQCPLTGDHAMLLRQLEGIDCNMAERGIIEDGTALGEGIANSVNRLKDSKAKSKVIILLTDGSNNRGDISPQMAAELAQAKGVRVYTIGLGSTGKAKYPYRVAGYVQYIMMDVDIDEASLRSIAETTDGKYYRATNNHQLSEIYKEIDKLEKSKLKVNSYSAKGEEYQLWVLLAIACLSLELLLRVTILKRIP